MEIKATQVTLDKRLALLQAQPTQQPAQGARTFLALAVAIVVAVSLIAFVIYRQQNQIDSKKPITK